jgi:hypothetical protein
MSNVTSALATIRGIHVEYGTRGHPMPYMRGITDFSSMNCVPNFFLDGAPFLVDGAEPPALHPFTALSDLINPELIKGIEVYDTSGTIPAQYDRTSSTGCGSIVIWMR